MSNTLITVVSFVLVLGPIIFVHELGHLLAAKAFGIRAFVFSFGFGRRLVGFKWGDTDCRVSAIPLGGYVRLEGEADDGISGETQSLGDTKDFSVRPRWQRFVVYLAGPAMNVLLTIVIATGFYRMGYGLDPAEGRLIVGVVEAGSPAEAAGVHPGDEILGMDGERFSTWEDSALHVALRPGRPIDVLLRTAAGQRKTTVTAGEDARKTGTIGVSPVVRVGSVEAGAPAAAAGIQTNDGILSVAGVPIQTFMDIPAALQGRAGQPVVFRILREGTTIELTVTPRDVGGQPRIGIGSNSLQQRDDTPSLARSLVLAVRWTGSQTVQTARILKQLGTARISPRTLEGPVRIAQAAGDAAKGGPAPILFLVTILSLQVGLLNLVPVAPLDGGHILLLGVEGLVRRDLPMAVKNAVMNAGFVAILALIGFVLYSDLSKTALLGKYLP